MVAGIWPAALVCARSHGRAVIVSVFACAGDRGVFQDGFWAEAKAREERGGERASGGSSSTPQRCLL